MKFVHDPSPEPHCDCGWPQPADQVANLGHCSVCHEPVMNAEILDHLRVMHPDEYGDGPERWPDGHVVIEHAEITPGDFTGETR